MNGRSSSQPGSTGSSTKTLICPPVPTLTATDSAWRATDPANEHWWSPDATATGVPDGRPIRDATGAASGPATCAAPASGGSNDSASPSAATSSRSQSAANTS